MPQKRAFSKWKWGGWHAPWQIRIHHDLSRLHLHLDFTRDNDDLSKELWDFTREIGDLTEKQIDLTGEDCSTYRYKMGINQIWGLRD